MREYPTELTPELRDVLGLMCFETGPIAQGFRADGVDIPHKVEAEQAWVLHWLIGLVLEHGPNWRRAAGNQIAEVLARVRDKAA